MLSTVRAVVRGGRIVLLEEIYIPEGTELLVTILTDHEDDHFEFSPPSQKRATDPIFEARFAESGRSVLHYAINESRRRHHNVLLLVHIFVAIKEVANELFNSGMEAVNVDPQEVSKLIEEELDKSDRKEGTKMYIAETTRELFNRALKRARKQRRRTIEAADLFVNLFSDSHGAPMEILRRLGADTTRLIDSV
jgi:hypothetical protein